MSDHDNEYRLPRYTITQVMTPLAEMRDWSIDFLKIPLAWKQTKGKGVVVAVLDTGVDTRHPDLQGAILDAKDFTGSMYGPEDHQGHGTHCCGSIGAREGNDKGTTGVAPECQILSGKVLGDDGSGDDRSVLAGLKWAMESGADIISMSLGGRKMGDRLWGALREFVATPGHFVFAAAGNDGRQNSVNFPAAWPECICVAAVDKTGRVAKFSSRGPRVDIAAPGVDIVAPIPGGTYARMSGTSMATPIAAAVGVLCLAKHRSQGGNSQLRNYLQMREHLRKTAIDKGTAGHDHEYGWGLICPEQMLASDAAAPPVLPPKRLAYADVVLDGRRFTGPLVDSGPANIDTTDYGDG